VSAWTLAISTSCSESMNSRSVAIVVGSGP
jgi:hypothetical protein